MTDLTEYLSTAMVADLHNVTRDAIRHAIRRDELPATFISGRWLIHADDANAWEGPREGSSRDRRRKDCEGGRWDAG